PMRCSMILFCCTALVSPQLCRCYGASDKDEAPLALCNRRCSSQSEGPGHVPPQVVRDHHLGIFGGELVGLGNHTDPGFRPVRARPPAADVVIVTGDYGLCRGLSAQLDRRTHSLVPFEQLWSAVAARRSPQLATRAP